MAQTNNFKKNLYAFLATGKVYDGGDRQTEPQNPDLVLYHGQIKQLSEALPNNMEPIAISKIRSRYRKENGLKEVLDRVVGEKPELKGLLEILFNKVDKSNRKDTNMLLQYLCGLLPQEYVRENIMEKDKDGAEEQRPSVPVGPAEPGVEPEPVTPAEPIEPVEEPIEPVEPNPTEPEPAPVTPITPEPEPTPVSPVTPEPEPVEPEDEDAIKKVRFKQHLIKDASSVQGEHSTFRERMMGFVRKHPILTTLGAVAGGALIGAIIPAIAGAGAFAAQGMFWSQLSKFGVSIATGAGLGLVAGGITVGSSWVGSRGKRLRARLRAQDSKIEAIKQKGANLEREIEIANQAAANLDKQSRKEKNRGKGIIKAVKRKYYRACRDYQLAVKKNKLDKLYVSQRELADKVEDFVDVKDRLDDIENTPNKKGKTKNYALGGYAQKKKKADERYIATGDKEEYDYALSDLETDWESLTGQEGLSKIDPDKYNSYDKKAMEHILAVKDKYRSDSMTAMMDRLAVKHGKESVEEEELITDAQIAKVGADTKEGNALKKAQAKQQAKIEAYSKRYGKSVEIVAVEKEDPEVDSEAEAEK